MDTQLSSRSHPVIGPPALPLAPVPLFWPLASPIPSVDFSATVRRPEAAQSYPRVIFVTLRGQVAEIENQFAMWIVES
jgi:hypothetical protein